MVSMQFSRAKTRKGRSKWLALLGLRVHHSAHINLGAGEAKWSIAETEKSDLESPAEFSEDGKPYFWTKLFMRSWRKIIVGMSRCYLEQYLVGKHDWNIVLVGSKKFSRALGFSTHISGEVTAPFIRAKDRRSLRRTHRAMAWLKLCAILSSQAPLCWARYTFQLDWI